MSGPDFPNIVAPPEWMADGLCAQVDPELFFPEAGAPNREAKAVCAGLRGPVRVPGLRAGAP